MESDRFYVDMTLWKKSYLIFILAMLICMVMSTSAIIFKITFLFDWLFPSLLILCIFLLIMHLLSYKRYYNRSKNSYIKLSNVALIICQKGESNQILYSDLKIKKIFYKRNRVKKIILKNRYISNFKLEGWMNMDEMAIVLKKNLDQCGSMGSEKDQWGRSN